MIQFAESEYNISMRQYETKLSEAKASNQDARAAKKKSIEDELVEEGLESIERYEATLNKRWENAQCLAEYDGLNMGFAIARRARARLAA